MSRTIHINRVGLAVLALSLCANAQSPQERSSIGAVLGMSTPVEELSTKASPAVVHIEYRAIELQQMTTMILRIRPHQAARIRLGVTSTLMVHHHRFHVVKRDECGLNPTAGPC
jgi:hypothetical protein